MPTLLEIAGVDAPDNLQGNSLVPILKGEQTANRGYAATGGSPTWHGAGPLTLTDGRWTYVCNPANGEWELYDKDADPGEENKIVEQNRAKAEELHQALVDFLAPLDCADWAMPIWHSTSPTWRSPI